MNDDIIGFTTTLKAAARRMEDYVVSHGVFGTWELGSLGLCLVVRHGRNECSQTVAWEQLAQSSVPDVLLRQAEERALRGISD